MSRIVVEGFELGQVLSRGDKNWKIFAFGLDEEGRHFARLVRCDVFVRWMNPIERRKILVQNLKRWAEEKQ